MSVDAVPTGAIIGILGGGQLGRMLALGAARIGYRTHIFSPDADAPAAQVSAGATVAGYDDSAALDEFARKVDVATYEFENVPVAAVETVAAVVPVRPSARALAVAQDRLAEKNFVRGVGAKTAPYVAMSGPDDAGIAAKEIGVPCIVKTRRLGYDGKGQRLVDRTSAIGESADEALKMAWADLGGVDCIVEGFVNFVAEVSVVLARGGDGAIAAYDAIQNRHGDGILRTSVVPARVPPEVAEAAESVARRIAGNLDHVGVLAVEMFVTADNSVLVNEIAPRVHNSGHWTLDAATTDQFEQHIRAICGLPLGGTARLADAEMTNLIGDEVEGCAAFLTESNACVHLYGKTAVRPGRKMGHVTRLFPKSG